ncbi:DUF4333 domain-containing protein [Mycobacterium sp. 1274761.0]|uniref:DUF4333 domain-containing protein n=1 Tax=Mycobacterium sp. 1274761.0 TaxID=1834077 RepID=UPI0007FBA909|nr:DUF4333 domain-containing protein [Mycobacterium sp. 1274761.0]OBK74117.1 hypothetical protein A5651_12600 [Mycobacterium sp. 1274761.0]
MRRVIGPVVGVAAALTTVAACSFSASVGPSVDKEELAEEISAQLEKQVGHTPESVKCPDDLKGEVGATTRCMLHDGGETYGVNVNVTKVEGTDVKFDLKVDDKPQ